MVYRYRYTTTSLHHERYTPSMLINNMHTEANGHGHAASQPGPRTGTSLASPDVPEGWTRCHHFVEKKGRFCRQLVVPHTHYCGNHFAVDDNDNDHDADNDSNSRVRRIPCPLDASHMIAANKVTQHVKVCPLRKKRQQQEAQPYFRRNVNAGGHGPFESIQNSCDCIPCPTLQNDKTLWAQRLALAVLKLHQRLFSSPSEINQHIPVSLLTRQHIHDAIPMRDLSLPELKHLSRSIEHYRIKAGGQHHVIQQASLIGHLRKLQVFENTRSANRMTTLLELGAGRGMLGLMASGVSVAAAKQINPVSNVESNGKSVELIMVERAGTRSKADTVLRVAQKDAIAMAEGNAAASTARNGDDKRLGNTSSSADNCTLSYLDLDSQYLTWKRIPGDLAHVHMPTVLESLEDVPCGESLTSSAKRKRPSVDDDDDNNTHRQRESDLKRNVVVVAKHLCGAATDLALKSLRDGVSVDVCIMATCCHGMCSWQQYVGRDSLRRAFQQHLFDNDVDGGDRGSSTLLREFGSAEFELLRRWSTSTVGPSDDEHGGSSSRPPDDGSHHTGADMASNGKDLLGAVGIVRSLKLQCGAKGLGRACQRLLDHGRCDYLKNVVFGGGDKCRVEVVHYVSPDVTPQNAVLVCSRVETPDNESTS